MWSCGGRGLIAGVEREVGEVVADGKEGGERLNLGHCSSRKAERGSKGLEGRGGEGEVEGVGVVWTAVGAERMEECISDMKMWGWTRAERGEEEGGRGGWGEQRNVLVGKGVKKMWH